MIGYIVDIEVEGFGEIFGRRGVRDPVKTVYIEPDLPLMISIGLGLLFMSQNPEANKYISEYLKPLTLLN